MEQEQKIALDFYSSGRRGRVTLYPEGILRAAILRVMLDCSVSMTTSSTVATLLQHAIYHVTSECSFHGTTTDEPSHRMLNRIFNEEN